MKDTEPAKEAIRYLTVSYNNPPSEKMSISIRDYLVARLEVENCQRPGPMETATLTEFQRAEKVNEKFAMKVARHKTSKGPAYLDYVRPHFAKPEVEALFVTRDGEAFPNGSIGKRVTCW